jgi:hypothetical protein
MAARCACVTLPGVSKDITPRDRLRKCWQRFDWLAQRAQHDFENGEQARDDLVAEHRTALDELVARGDLEADVADEIHIAFGAAVYHVWRTYCGMTCYEPLPGPEYTPVSSGQLVQQAELLADLADDTSVDQNTVAQAQATIERDVAFLNLSSEDEQALYDELMNAAGEGYHHPSFDQVDFEITPEAAEAARFLVELLLEEPE